MRRLREALPIPAGVPATPRRRHSPGVVWRWRDSTARESASLLHVRRRLAFLRGAIVTVWTVLADGPTMHPVRATAGISDRHF